MSLTFDALRSANLRRLPQFKNAKGEPAHSKPDGSDWSPSDWITAITGELGEAANLIKKLRRGDFYLYDTLGKELTVRKALAKEFADVVTYLDILASQFDIDLGVAVIEKFNEVSQRVGADVRLEPTLTVPPAPKFDHYRYEAAWARVDNFRRLFEDTRGNGAITHLGLKKGRHVFKLSLRWRPGKAMQIAVPDDPTENLEVSLIP